MSRITRSALARSNVIVDEPEPVSAPVNLIVSETAPAVPEPPLPTLELDALAAALDAQAAKVKGLLARLQLPARPAAAASRNRAGRLESSSSSSRAPAVPEPAPAVPEPAPAVPEPAPAVPEPAPAVPDPADNLAAAAAEYMCDWLVSIDVPGSDDDIEIRYGEDQLFIFENYIDKNNIKNTAKTKITPGLLKSLLRLWFKSLRMDTHSKWTHVNAYFSLMPSIDTSRANLSRDRAQDLIDHIMDAVDFHIALAAVNM